MAYKHALAHLRMLGYVQSSNHEYASNYVFSADKKKVIFMYHVHSEFWSSTIKEYKPLVETLNVLQNSSSPS